MPHGFKQSSNPGDSMKRTATSRSLFFSPWSLEYPFRPVRIPGLEGDLTVDSLDPACGRGSIWLSFFLMSAGAADENACTVTGS